MLFSFSGINLQKIRRPSPNNVQFWYLLNTSSVLFKEVFHDDLKTTKGFSGNFKQESIRDSLGAANAYKRDCQGPHSAHILEKPTRKWTLTIVPQVQIQKFN